MEGIESVYVKQEPDDDIDSSDLITIQVDDIETSEDESEEEDFEDVKERVIRNSLSVVRKPRHVKYLNTNIEQEIILSNDKSKLKKARRKIITKPYRAIRRVVTDSADDINKLKRPGPFQTNYRTVQDNTPSELPNWVSKLNQPNVLLEESDVDDVVIKPTIQTKASIPCEYCTATLSTKLECDLHVSAHHKHEISSQIVPLPCLEAECQSIFSSLYKLKSHLKKDHNIEMVSKFHTFQDTNKFTAWKTALETSSGARFLFFSSYSEVSGGNTKVYVCTNDGTYDHTFFKHTFRRSCRELKEPKKKGRACTAQLLVRSRGWGAIEVEALVTHYGHNIQEPSSPPPPLPPSHSSASHLDSSHISSSHRPEREDGVRIIEGSLIGSLGMEGLADDLAKWGLFDSVSICVCKRIHENVVMEQLVPKDAFVLAFITNEQLDAWADYGQRAIYLDCCKVFSPQGHHSASVCSVCVVNDEGITIPVAWLVTSSCNENLLKYFLVCCKTAYESYHNSVTPVPEFLIGDIDNSLCKNWMVVFSHSPHLILGSWSVNKDWMAALSRVKDMGKKVELGRALYRIVNHTDDSKVMGGMRDLARSHRSDRTAADFAAYLLDQWMPGVTASGALRHSQSPDLEYHTRIYLSVAEKLLHFLFLDSNFNTNFDSFILNIHSHTENLMKDLDTPTPSVPFDSNTGQFTAPTVYNSSTGQYITAEAQDSSTSLPTRHLESLIAERHREASFFSRDSVVPAGQHSWRVKCLGRANDRWQVVKRALPRKGSMGSIKNMCSVSCKKVCRQCLVCVHQFTCTCVDSKILSTICVHIHLIRICMRKPQSALPEKITPSFSQYAGVEEPLDNHATKDKIRAAIRKKCASILSLTNVSNPALPREDLLQCDKLLSNIISNLQRREAPASQKELSYVSSISSTVGDTYCEVETSGDGTTEDGIYNGVDITNSVTFAEEESVINIKNFQLGDDKTKGLLLLQDEDGQYRLVPQEEEGLMEGTAILDQAVVNDKQDVSTVFR